MLFFYQSVDWLLCATTWCLQLNISLQARPAVSNLTILISCYVVGWLRWTLNHSVLLDLVSVYISTLVCSEDRKWCGLIGSLQNKKTIKMRKNGESDQSFKNRFTAERSRQFDLLQSKEVADQNADGCSKRACEFLKPEYQLKPSDGRRQTEEIELFD